MLHKRTNAVGIKEGDLCLRGKYITAASDEDTKTIAAAFLLHIFAGLPCSKL